MAPDLKRDSISRGLRGVGTDTTRERRAPRRPLPETRQHTTGEMLTRLSRGDIHTHTHTHIHTHTRIEQSTSSVTSSNIRRCWFSICTRIDCRHQRPHLAPFLSCPLPPSLRHYLPLDANWHQLDHGSFNHWLATGLLSAYSALTGAAWPNYCGIMTASLSTAPMDYSNPAALPTHLISNSMSHSFSPPHVASIHTFNSNLTSDPFSNLCSLTIGRLIWMILFALCPQASTPRPCNTATAPHRRSCSRAPSGYRSSSGRYPPTGTSDELQLQQLQPDPHLQNIIYINIWKKKLPASLSPCLFPPPNPTTHPIPALYII